MAKSQFDTFRDLDVTRDEIERIGEALKDTEFRKLFGEYVDEVTDPENRKIFEKELTELERQRGVEVTFIHPSPGYVIKTSLNGSKKAFVNVCANEHIGQPTSRPTSHDGNKGLQWSLPHSLSPPREDMDNKRQRCQVFDVVFHPDTLHLAMKNPAFKHMVNKTACDAIETSFDCKLDQRNLKFPNLKFKGLERATVIRKPMEAFKKDLEECEILNKIYDQLPKYETAHQPSRNSKSKKVVDDTSKYTTPKFEVKHRNSIEMEDFTYHRSSKLNATVPRELVVEIYLPLLKAATDIDLDVTEKTVQLQSEKPAKYKLSLTLPYKVDELNGNAKFDKDTKKLIVTLPVKRSARIVNDFAKEDSGVESDHGSVSPVEEVTTTTPETQPSPFLDSSVVYNLPEFTTHLSEMLNLTLSVKNVNSSTVAMNFDGNRMHLKFTSISASHFSAHYAFFIQLPSHRIRTETTTVEVWDNNVVLQIDYTPTDKPLTKFMAGLDENNVEEQLIERAPAITAMIKQDEKSLEVEKNAENKTIPQQKANKVVDTVELKLEPVTRGIHITRSFSESSADELSASPSYSPKQKGILKRLSLSRASVSRSISESSIDEYAWASSFENCFSASQDCMIPEEEPEPSTSLKKTVRFNNNVVRQLFRSNSSILGQRKKNQRRNRNKKRAQERRYSESEISERDAKTAGREGDHKKDEHIFAIDL